MPANIIPLTEAAIMTATLRAEQNNILVPARRDEGLIPICETFERSAFDAILAQRDCDKVRIYTAMDDDLKIRFVITGVNKEGEDIFLIDSSDPVGVESVIEAGLRCPDICPPASPLNS